MIIIGLLLLIEMLYHVYTLRVLGPTRQQDADRPFQIGCRVPDESGPRANATILMLAQNSDIEGALIAVRSLERHFNRWYRYPITFLNNEPWHHSFIEALSNATSGETTFDVIPAHMWTFPDWMDVGAARASIRKQDSLVHAGREGYHHMCRFFSGFFYDVPVMQKYRWFWRLEPDAEISCAVTYDPFLEMERRNKKYGYSIALWEVGKTVPSLFRLVDDYRRLYLESRITEVWKAMLDAAWVPWPFRSLFSWASHHTASGDYWNFCHYWSNFEIADMDFFRSDDYRRFFDYLDRSGGFYFERFGDAPVHSLAAALLLKPSEIHHFDDFGYRHNDLWVQPDNAKGLQMPATSFTDYTTWTDETADGIGCRCVSSKWKTPFKTTNVAKTCSVRLGQAIR